MDEKCDGNQLITFQLRIYLFKKLNYGCFTILYQFQVYSRVIQLHTHRYTHMLFFRFFSIIDYYKILSIVPCAIQLILVIHLSYIQQCIYGNLIFLIYPCLPLFPLVIVSLSSRSVSLFLFCKEVHLFYFLRFYI